MSSWKIKLLEKLWLHYNPGLRGEVTSETCNLIYQHSLKDLSVDCLDIYREPFVQCECCQTCCDSVDEKCIVVISTPIV